jgi:hypothetical protein
MPGTLGPRPEPIPAPKETPGKKMPSGSGTGSASAETITPYAAPLPSNAPRFETAPAIVPNLPANTFRREPF